MIPTPFAETLAEPIAYALGAIYNSLNATSRFEPATSTRAFTIAMTDIGEIYFLPTLMRRLGQGRARRHGQYGAQPRRYVAR